MLDPALKRHTGRILAKDEELTDAGVTRKGLLQPATAASVMNAFGVEIERRHMWLDDPEDPDQKSIYEEGGRILVGKREFAIEARRALVDIGEASHCLVLLNEVVRGS